MLKSFTSAFGYNTFLFLNIWDALKSLTVIKGLAILINKYGQNINKGTRFVLLFDSYNKKT